LRSAIFGDLLRTPRLGPGQKALYALDLWFPPLSSLGAWFLAAVGLNLMAWGAGRLPIALATVHAAMAGVLAAYLLGPVIALDMPARHLLALLLAPYYAVWKLAVTLGRMPKSWVRTERELAIAPGEER